MNRRTPIREGVLLAGLAAVLFGATAPLLQRASHGAGAFASGGILYLGAALASLGALLRRPTSEAPLKRADVPRLAAMACLGGVLGPAALVLGLQRTDAASAALLLALEAPFTFLLARAVYHEHLGRRVWAAVVLIFLGGAVLGGRGVQATTSLAGVALVALATLLWALDNTLSRKLADRDPVAVVGWKGLLGGSGAVLVALAADNRWPSVPSIIALLCIGAAGYGLSLRIYLRAQRLVGAARTASVFAAAPFVGAAVALVTGAGTPGFSLAASSALIMAGVWLHASEHHRHLHRHVALEHEHAHVHSDAHHGHAHDGAPTEPHSHLHRHEALEHEHEHGEDQHHIHPH